MSEPKSVEAPPRLTPDGETEFNVLMGLTKAHCGYATAPPMGFSQRERRRSLSTGAPRTDDWFASTGASVNPW